MLRAQGHFSTDDIERITWQEAERYVKFFSKNEQAAAAKNAILMLECIVVSRGRPEDIKRFVKKIAKETNESDAEQESSAYDIENEFKGVNFV